ncbi:MAG: T9SS type A sorting domain-containing protein [Saprospiraceae bacterium]|nr:T9SS type A sorting domain-containing protein [Saprospiraceae bacterium]
MTHQGAITACRHANGRDWWIVSPERFSKKINTFLLTPYGIAYQGDQVLSDTLLDFSYAPSFSPDGQWYARTHIKSISMWKAINYAQLIPFDRCSGTFGDPITFTFPYEDSVGIVSIIFSPNSRYFYALCYTSIWQGDLTAPDIPASLVRVARYDPTIIDRNTPLTFGVGFLGPDGKIYIFDGRYNFRSSVIHSPDSLGLACDARYASLMKPSCTGMSVGNMPDFNLGPIDGSSCDTLGLDNPLSTHTSDYTKSAPLEIYPNPSTGHFSVNVPSQNGFLAVIDMKGQHVRTISVPRFKMVVDVSLPAGAYIITYYSDDGKIIARGKVAVMGN